MLPPKSREHRMRVLQNQAKMAERGASTDERRDAQLKIPLIVEVKGRTGRKPRVRRARQKPEDDQTDLGDL